MSRLLTMGSVKKRTSFSAQFSLASLRGTRIVIAHRLSTIMNADKILVLYNGSIVEEGVHAELIERRGMYHQLVQKQMMSAA